METSIDKLIKTSPAIFQNQPQLPTTPHSTVPKNIIDKFAAAADRATEKKWWKRTKLLRKLSKSIKKRRDKLKKRWGERFSRNATTQQEALPARYLAKPSLNEETVPRCAVVSMARNEAERADEVMRHFCALFDQIVVIDHCSNDETGNIVAGYAGQSGANVVVLRSDESGYHQSEYMTAAAHALIASECYEWVFFLDFDEFLPFATKDAFHQAMVQHSDSDVIYGHWLNCMLTDPNASEINGAEAVISETVSQFVKIALNARRLVGRDVVVQQGNHAVTLDGNPEPVTGNRAFGVLHFPIVSVEHLERRLREGVSSYDAMDRAETTHGFHWRELHEHLGKLKDDPALLRAVTLRYGDSLFEVLGEHLNSPDPNIKGRPLRLGFAQAPKCTASAAVNAARVDRTTLERVLAGLLPEPHDHADEAIGQAPFPAIYETLAPTIPHLAPADRDMRLRKAIFSGAQKIEVIVPTAWTNHPPFLFSLMEAMRPRRYVELGTHAGQSFFIACQHYKSNGNYGEAVAIDLWEGDHQAGFYDEKVFNNFKFLLNRHYPACGRYIRGYFSEAVAAFEEGSIDLLHIDGLHTYGAVREDYETWRSRLTGNGTIIFHDTSEFQTDFGVWQLFQEVRADAAASFNFQHGHGLGVLAFGTPDTNPAIELLNYLNEDPSLFERHYAILGNAMFQCARMEAQQGRK